MEITYNKYGDYYLPNLVVSTEGPTYGRFGRIRLKYLKEYRRVAYHRMHNGSLGISPSLCESAEGAHVNGDTALFRHQILNSWTRGGTNRAQHRKWGLGRFGNIDAEHGPQYPYVVFVAG